MSLLLLIKMVLCITKFTFLKSSHIGCKKLLRCWPKTDAVSALFSYPLNTLMVCVFKFYQSLSLLIITCFSLSCLQGRHGEITSTFLSFQRQIKRKASENLHAMVWLWTLLYFVRTCQLRFKCCIKALCLSCLPPVWGDAVISGSLGITTEMAMNKADSTAMNKADSTTWDPERCLNV